MSSHAEVAAAVATAAEAVTLAERGLSAARAALQSAHSLAGGLADPPAPPVVTLERLADGTVKVAGRVVFDVIAPPPPPAPVPAAPRPDHARRFASALGLGINVERAKLQAMRYGTADLTQRPWYGYIAGLGLDWVRFFVPYNGADERGVGTGPPPPVARWDSILSGAEAAIAEGHRVVVAATDVLDAASVERHWPAVLAHVEAVARRIAERGFRPHQLAIGTANELARHDNGYWNGRRMELHAAIRRHLPEPWIVVHGAADWNGWRRFDATWQDPPDGSAIASFHHYGSEGGPGWTRIGEDLAAFGAARGLPVVCGEVADVMDPKHMRQSPGNVARWTANIHAVTAHAGLLRPCLWCVSGDGLDFRLQRSASDATLLPEIEACLRACRVTLRNLPGYPG